MKVAEEGRGRKNNSTEKEFRGRAHFVVRRVVRRSTSRLEIFQGARPHVQALESADRSIIMTENFFLRRLFFFLARKDASEDESTREAGLENRKKELDGIFFITIDTRIARNTKILFFFFY